MMQWSKEQLEEMCGDDVIDQLVFLSGCNKHRYSNDEAIPDGWIISDESLRKFAKLIVEKCAMVSERTGALNEADYEGEIIANAIKEHFGVE